MQKDSNRDITNVIDFIESNFAKNAVSGNLSSAMTNFIVAFENLGHDLATNFGKYAGMALRDVLFMQLGREDYTNKSDFLTSRFGDERIYKTPVQKVGNVLSMPFEGVDKFTAQWISRTKYLEQLNKGQTPEEAMRAADEYAADMMGDRSTGALPTQFMRKNPIWRAINMFQFEMRNTLSYISKDLPRKAREIGGAKGKAWLFGVYATTALMMWLFNKMNERLTGRKPAPDVIDTVWEFANDIMDDNTDWGLTTEHFVENASNIIPFMAFPLALFGFDNAGRIPLQGAIPNISNLVSKQGDIKKDLIDPLIYGLNPFGGYAQLNKTVTGTQALIDGKSTSKSGLTRFPVEPTVGNMIRAPLFGQWATSEGREYLQNNYRPFGKTQSENFEQAQNAGIPYNLYRKVLKETGKMTSDKDKQGKTIQNSLSMKKKKYIDALPDLTRKQKKILYEAAGVGSSLWQ